MGHATSETQTTAQVKNPTGMALVENNNLKPLKKAGGKSKKAAASVDMELDSENIAPMQMDAGEGPQKEVYQKLTQLEHILLR